MAAVAAARKLRRKQISALSGTLNYTGNTWPQNEYAVKSDLLTKRTLAMYMKFILKIGKRDMSMFHYKFFFLS